MKTTDNLTLHALIARLCAYKHILVDLKVFFEDVESLKLKGENFEISLHITKAMINLSEFTDFLIQQKDLHGGDWLVGTAEQPVMYEFQPPTEKVTYDP